MHDLTENIYQAALLMIVGMAFVYLFLILLILTLKYVIAPLGALGLLVEDVKQRQSHISDGVSPKLIAVIAAAIKQHSAQPSGE